MDTIKIYYEISGIIKIKLSCRQGETNIKRNTTIEDFITTKCGIKKKYLKYLDVTINGEHKSYTYKLNNNDKILILMPIGGG